MSIFTAAAIGGNGLGPIAGGWIEMNPHLGWRWIQWIHTMYIHFSGLHYSRLIPLYVHRLTGAYLILVLAIMKETRSSILLTQLAKKLRKSTGDNRYRARVEDERQGLWTLIFISFTRPICTKFHYMWTRTRVLPISQIYYSPNRRWQALVWVLIYRNIWLHKPDIFVIALDWLCVGNCIWHDRVRNLITVHFSRNLFRLLGRSISPSFKALYGFNTGELGNVYIGMVWVIIIRRNWLSSSSHLML